MPPDDKQGYSDKTGGKEKAVLTTGKSEIDKKIDAGIPLRSLTLIEGEHDSGKSVLTQQIVWGAMKQGLCIDLFSSETTPTTFLPQMETMSLDISDYYAWGYIRLFPILGPSLDMEKEKMEELLQRLLAHMTESPAQIIIIDSLTLFTEYTTNEVIIDFFTGCKALCDKGKTIFITLHPYAFDEDTLVRIRSVCDALLTLKRALIGDKYLMVLEVVKIRGAHKTRENVVSFEVVPGYGMKIIPISVAKV
ncbi:MAG: ATPase domain-containing protein [Methanomicrobiales archaeon]|jgi:flagellar protein FlaH